MAKNGKAASTSEVTTEAFPVIGDLDLDMFLSVYRDTMNEDRAQMTGMIASPFPSSKTKETL